MASLIQILLAVAVLCTAPLRPSVEPPITYVFHPVYNSRLTIPSYFRAVGFINDIGCSATIVKNRYVVTAAHCVDGVDETFVTFLGVAIRKFKVVRRGHKDLSFKTILPNDIAKDWAILTGDTMGIEPLQLAKSPGPDIGATISLNPVTGRVQIAIPTAITGVETTTDGPVIVLSGWLVPGDSGSPIIGSNGQILAILSAHDGSYLPVAWGVSSATVLKAMEGLK